MISRIDHVSIAVKDIDRALHFFQNVLGAVQGVGESDPDMKYNWRIFSLGDLSRLELLNPAGPGSFLDNFLNKHPSGGVHHLTLQTPDIQKAVESLDREGIAYFGYRDMGETWKEVFIHPKDAFGVLIQIAEFDPDDYLAPELKLKAGKKWELEKKEDGALLIVSHPGGGKAAIEIDRSQIRSLIRDLEAVLED